MSKARGPYTPAFRLQMTALVSAGRDPKDLVQEFEPSAQTTRNWATRADLDEGRRSDGLTSDEREELRPLREEREISAALLEETTLSLRVCRLGTQNENPFKYFKTSPEIIRRAVMMYVGFPLSLRQVEDLLHERCIDVCHEPVRY